MDKKKLGLWAPILVLAAALVMLAVSTGGVEAARGGKGGGKPSTSTATISVSPNPAPVGITHLTVSGGGFKSGEGLSVGLPGTIPSYSIVTDSSGSFSFTYTRYGSEPFSAGSYTFQAMRWKNGWMPGPTTILVVQ